MISIAIDHGNKQIKTANRTFTSGLRESDTKPPFGEDTLVYKGKYYSLSDKRIPYMRNKTEDDRFYILTLFAAAYEIEAAGAYEPDEITPVRLLIGLPPAHFGEQYERFEKYFTRGDVEAFEFRRKPFEIYIKEAVAYPQAFAAAMPVFQQICGYPKVMVIDIGGFTADYLLIKNGQADRTVCDSLENGVIVLYNQIIARVNSDFDLLLDESDIDAILREQGDYKDGVRSIVLGAAQTFVNDLFATLRERMIDLRSGRTVFVGGGSVLLRKQIEASGKVDNPIFVDSISANAKGYEILYAASKGR